MIRFLDLQRQHGEIETRVNEAVASVLRAGRFILGEHVTAFETEWAAYCGVPDAAGVASGTDALTLALIATAAVRPGHQDEVITSPLTASYTAVAIIKAGGVPIFADIDPETYTLDANAVSRAITPRTRAVVPVHLYGQICDMDALCSAAARHGLIVIEDAAQVHGARLGDRSSGAFGAAGAFSFYPTKNLGACGDAGAVVSVDKNVITMVNTLRQAGTQEALQEDVVGWNSRLDEIQAAILRAKLPYLDQWNQKRRSLAALYSDELRGIPKLRLPTAISDDAHVWHLYVVQHPDRDRLRAHLSARGIETLVHYPFLLHHQRLLRSSAQRALPVAEEVAPRLLSLPLYPQLKVDEAYDVVKAIRSF
ncbi:MAG TPA: DegT/DnrJ/EryC1/StrS family aminotransferase [Pyrinomonadaceae bacterium]|nr:DegT/DnrJ/EryC1/StrS family aminotransferase [Pyrinomonadaceae bacterium]